MELKKAILVDSELGRGGDNNPPRPNSTLIQVRYNSSSVRFLVIALLSSVPNS
jgi:hypothetical protein